MNLLRVAWLAGLTDGEGSIFARWKGTDGRSLESVWTLGMTSLETIQEVVRVLHQITGRKYRIYQGHSRNPKHRPWYRVSVQRKAALIKLLETLSPLLVTKKRQAECLLRLVSVPNVHCSPGHPTERAPWMQEVMEDLKQLNQKGIPTQAGTVPEGRETGRFAPLSEGTVQ